MSKLKYLTVIFAIIILIVLVMVFQTETQHPFQDNKPDHEVEKYLINHQDMANNPDEVQEFFHLWDNHDGIIEFHADDVLWHGLSFPELRPIVSLAENCFERKYHNGHQILESILIKWQPASVVDWNVKLQIFEIYNKYYKEKLDISLMRSNLKVCLHNELDFYYDLSAHPSYMDNPNNDTRGFDDKLKIWINRMQQSDSTKDIETLKKRIDSNLINQFISQTQDLSYKTEDEVT